MKLRICAAEIGAWVPVDKMECMLLSRSRWVQVERMPASGSWGQFLSVLILQSLVGRSAGSRQSNCRLLPLRTDMGA